MDCRGCGSSSCRDWLTRGDTPVCGHCWPATKVVTREICPVKAEAQITFTKTYGGRSWIVHYNETHDHVIWEKSQPPHVELRNRIQKDANTTDGIYSTMQPGTAYKIANLRKINGKCVLWDVVGLKTEYGKQAHFVVHYGDRPLEDFIPKDFKQAS